MKKQLLHISVSASSGLAVHGKSYGIQSLKGSLQPITAATRKACGTLPMQRRVAAGRCLQLPRPLKDKKTPAGKAKE